MNQDQTFNFMLAKVRGMLREESVLEDKDAVSVFCHTFRIPSGAAEVVVGSSSIGWVEWKNNAARHWTS